MEEIIFKFINDENFHSECESGGSGIEVETLNTFFKVLFGGADLSNKDELEKYFGLNK